MRNKKQKSGKSYKEIWYEELDKIRKDLNLEIWLDQCDNWDLSYDDYFKWLNSD